MPICSRCIAPGCPFQVTVYNTPLRYKDSLVADIGLYAQDTWTLNRLTINAGLRWEYMDAEVSASTSGQGRFVPERTFDAIPMPVWKDFAPRLGVVYDLFGNAKTALKFGVQPLQRVADHAVRGPLQPAHAARART